MENKIAIIIPYFKIDFFEETLKSLEAQTEKNFWVYIGNDNSPYDPQHLIETTLIKTKYTYKKFNENFGRKELTKQWQRCVEMCKDEDWILILGDDDILEKNCIEVFYKNIDLAIKNKCTVLRFSTKLINEKSFVQAIHSVPLLAISSKESYINKLMKIGRSSLSEHIFSKNEIMKKGFKQFPVAFGSDDIAVLECANFKNIFCLGDTCFVGIRNSGVNISSSKDKSIGRQGTRGIFLYNKYILKNYASEFTIEQKKIIAAKAYNRMRHTSRRLDLDFFSFIMLMIKRLGWRTTFQILCQNSKYPY